MIDNPNQYQMATMKVKVVEENPWFLKSAPRIEDL